MVTDLGLDDLPVPAINAGFAGREAFATGWLERSKGTWLMTTSRPEATFRRHMLPSLAQTTIEPTGYQIITIPESLRAKIKNTKDELGNPLRDLSRYSQEWNESFAYQFVKPTDLTKKERLVYDQTGRIFQLIGGRPRMVKDILISTTMRIAAFNHQEAAGIWEPSTQRIIIKRDQLKNIQSYAGTLLHETAHAISGASDISEEFETALRNNLGTDREVWPADHWRQKAPVKVVLR